MTNISITDYAWAAGIIDGEGCLYIQKNKPTKGAKNSIYCGRIRVSMTHLETIKRLHTIFGGNFYSRNRQHSNEKNQFAWEVTALKCKQVISLIIEFLFTKKEEAKLLYEFLELPKATTFKETPNWLLEKREELYSKIRDLKLYNFEITSSTTNVVCKKNIKSKCSVCGKEMSAFNSNGIEKTFCSNKCKYKNNRVLTDNEEKLLVDNYNSGDYSYAELSNKFGIKRGTVGWIIKKYASIPTIS